MYYDLFATLEIGLLQTLLKNLINLNLYIVSNDQKIFE